MDYTSINASRLMLQYGLHFLSQCSTDATLHVTCIHAQLLLYVPHEMPHSSSVNIAQ